MKESVNGAAKFRSKLSGETLGFASVRVNKMGHDIYGYQVRTKEVAYLRRGAGTNYRNLYEWLNVTHAGAGNASGDGSYHRFYEDELREALAMAETYGEPDEIEFLKECIKVCDETEGVLIHFG